MRFCVGLRFQMLQRCVWWGVGESDRATVSVYRRPVPELETHGGPISFSFQWPRVRRSATSLPVLESLCALVSANAFTPINSSPQSVCAQASEVRVSTSRARYTLKSATIKACVAGLCVRIQTVNFYAFTESAWIKQTYLWWFQVKTLILKWSVMWQRVCVYE